MHQIDKRAQFFDERFFNLYDRSIILKELILQIRHIVKPPASILESGYGSGLTSVLLANMGYQVTGIDANQELIQGLERFETAFPNLSFHQMDMFHINFAGKNFDLVFKQGVLKHCSDEGIIYTLIEQRGIAKAVVIDVPNTRRMARWSDHHQKLLGWLEDSWLSQKFGENSIFYVRRFRKPKSSFYFY